MPPGTSPGRASVAIKLHKTTAALYRFLRSSSVTVHSLAVCDLSMTGALHVLLSLNLYNPKESMMCLLGVVQNENDA